MCKFHARRRRSVPLLAAVLLVPVIMRADAPKFTGTWQMDEAKSQVADGRVVTLVLDASDTLVKITQTIKTKAGQESSTQFSVTMGKECDYNEGSHKSKLVAWYAGPSLNIVKSDGPPGDIANQWVLQLSPDQKTLTLTFSHVDPAGKDETLVFNRK
ncbi:MAG: hypothetical protein JO270_22105 [Acidobacteriaceae bacterium]|nr:hypothetical protein [Acidobacteriaceae bacterium]MBV8571748.1 hypothetical protein [Acidobacteriaceae bacterium]